MRSFLIIWPERREVLPKQIFQWTADAIANGEIESGYAEAMQAGDSEECALALHNAGVITLADRDP